MWPPIKPLNQNNRWKITVGITSRSLDSIVQKTYLRRPSPQTRRSLQLALIEWTSTAFSISFFSYDSRVKNKYFSCTKRLFWLPGYRNGNQISRIDESPQEMAGFSDGSFRPGFSFGSVLWMPWFGPEQTTRRRSPLRNWPQIHWLPDHRDTEITTSLRWYRSPKCYLSAIWWPKLQSYQIHNWLFGTKTLL